MSICLREETSAPVTAKTATPNQSSVVITSWNMMPPLAVRGRKTLFRPHCRPSCNPVWGTRATYPPLSWQSGTIMSLHHAMRRTIFGALAIVTLTVAPALAADPVFPLASRVGLVPPPGFLLSGRFAGFETPQANAAILLLSMPNEAYPEIEKNFTDEALKSLGIQVATREAMTFKDGKGGFAAGPKEQDGTKRYEARMIANLAGVTALVSVQMLESSRATVTDAVVKEALKTLAVRQQVPEAERLAVLPYKIGELAGFRVVVSADDGLAVLTLGPKDAVENVEQPFVLMSVVIGEAPKP